MLFVFFISVYHAIYLEEMVASEVARKLALVFNIPFHQINQVYRQGPTGIHILVSDQVTGMPFPPLHWCLLLYVLLKSCRKTLWPLLPVLMSQSWESKLGGIYNQELRCPGWQKECRLRRTTAQLPPALNSDTGHGETPSSWGFDPFYVKARHLDGLSFCFPI